MSYEKKVIVLSSVLVALLAIWGLGLVFSPERVAARSESAHLVPGKTADVASISIASPGAPAIELAKAGSPPLEPGKAGAAWELVDGAPGAPSVRFPVRAEKVASFLGDLSAVARLKLVARSKDSWAGFKLDDAQAKRATLKDASGKVLADIWLGGYGPAGSEVYLRHGGSDSSYLADSGFASYLDYGRSGWLDLALFGGVKEGDVQSFSLKSDIALDGKGKPSVKLDYSLKRDGQAWKSGAAQIDAEAAAALLRSLIGLHGEDYVAAPPADAFAKLGATIKLDLGTGAALALDVGKEEAKDRFYVRQGGSGRVALVSSYSLKSCLKSLAELSKK
jgi:hypothetical protein